MSRQKEQKRPELTARIRQLMRNEGLRSWEEFGKRAEISNRTMYRHKVDHRWSADQIRDISRAYGVPFDVLWVGAENTVEVDQGAVEVPVPGFVTAGLDGEPRVETGGKLPALRLPVGVRAMRVLDGSLEPFACQGDYIFAEDGAEVNAPGMAIITDTDGKSYVRHYFCHGDALILLPNSPDRRAQSIVLQRDRISSISRVSGVWFAER